MRPARLIETIGSWAAALHAGPERQVVGIELNVSYLRSATSGVVTAVCTPVRRGRTLATFLIEVSDDEGRPTATGRLTCLTKCRLTSVQPSTASAAAGSARTAGRRRAERPPRRGHGQPAALPGRQRPGQRLEGDDPAGGERREAHPREEPLPLGLVPADGGDDVGRAGLPRVAGGRGQESGAGAATPVLAVDDEGCRR